MLVSNDCRYKVAGIMHLIPAKLYVFAKMPPAIFALIFVDMYAR